MKLDKKDLPRYTKAYNQVFDSLEIEQLVDGIDPKESEENYIRSFVVKDMKRELSITFADLDDNNDWAKCFPAPEKILGYGDGKYVLLELEEFLLNGGVVIMNPQNSYNGVCPIGG